MTEAAMSSTAPAKASLAAETTPATATPVKRLVPTAITLLLRDDGTLVLRAESPDAVDGFYNVDRDENSPQARWRMRRRGQELAGRHVLADGKVVGRIFKVNAAPVGEPWMWTLIFPHHEGRSPTHGYEATRAAAMAAFAKSWRRE
jgi:hypothetical protein